MGSTVGGDLKLTQITVYGGTEGIAADKTDVEGLGQERQEYLQRIRARYRRVDLEILTPLTEQGEHPVMLLSEVFFQQSVRENPPPVELLNLPREVLHRLVADEQLSGLPDNIDLTRLEEARRAYQERPARPVLEALGRTSRAVVLGDPGAGKSTLARFMMMALAITELQQDSSGELAVELPAEWVGRLPLLVELRTYADPAWRGKTFLDLIDEMRSSHHLGLSKVRLERYLSDGGRALVVFDGLDEIFDPQVRADVVGQIEGFVARYPNVRTIVTSRVVGYNRSTLDAAGFTTFMLQDLDTLEIEAFITTWYKRSCPGDPATATQMRHRLLAAINASMAVGEIAGNPMLLTILAIIGRRRELPHDRRTVYQHAVTVLIEHWDVNKHLRAHDTDLPQLIADDKLRMLHSVARRMQDGPAGLAGNHIPARDLIEAFETYFTEEFGLPKDRAVHAARAMLRQFQHRNFILSSFGAGLYGFVHRAFLEYLAADDINQQLTDRKLTDHELFDLYDVHATDPAWREVLLLLTGMIPELLAGEVISRLAVTGSYGRFDEQLPTSQLLALSAISEIRRRQTLRSLAPTITQLLVELIRTAAVKEDEYDLTLTAAIEKSLPPFGHETAWLDHSQRERWRLATGNRIGMLHSARYIAARLRLAVEAQTLDTLKGHATTSAEAVIRFAAVEAIAEGWRDDPETFAWLRERGVEDGHEGVRRGAVEAIAEGWRDDPETFAWLRERGVEDRHEDVRRAAVEAIAEGWRDDPETFAWLRERGVEDRHEGVRRAALRAVAESWRDDPEILPWLRERATGDRHEDVRIAAFDVIAEGWRDDLETSAWLRDRVVREKRWIVRSMVVDTIAAGGPHHPETLAWLRDCAVRDEHWIVRRAAVRAVDRGGRDDPETFAWLRERATEDTDEDVRSTAVRAIGQGWRDDPEVLPWLRERGVEDRHEDVRRAAVEAIAEGWRDDPETFAWLRERGVEDRHEGVRRAALRAVAESWRDDPEVLPWLRERGVEDRHEEARRAAVEVIAESWPDNPETLTWLRERATEDRHEDVRSTAVRAIGQGWRDDPEILPWLRERGIEDRHEDVRRAAVEVIAEGWRDDPETFAWLRERGVEDGHEGVRRAAVEAIAESWPDNPETLTWLRERGVEDRHEDVRSTAVRAIGQGWRDNPETLAWLRDRAVRDEHWIIRRAAVRAVDRGGRDDPETFAWLRERGVEDGHEGVRSAAVEVIASGWPDDPETLAWLRERATEDTDEDVRSTVVRA
ncbi:HEAT repeat domain-containing protein, partial [Nonomuraea sp. NPDC003709]|uniref:HEAT repeat domain-containing protein n=1 Tax=Nonomuraea sp. NPDC003709 TaxID=3154450 RepID=UPI0033BAD0DA